VNVNSINSFPVSLVVTLLFRQVRKKICLQHAPLPKQQQRKVIVRHYFVVPLHVHSASASSSNLQTQSYSSVNSHKIITRLLPYRHRASRSVCNIKPSRRKASFQFPGSISPPCQQELILTPSGSYSALLSTTAFPERTKV